MIAAIGTQSAGAFRSAFQGAMFNVFAALRTTQLLSPMEQAASIRFSAARQQSAATNGPIGFPQITIKVPTSWNRFSGSAGASPNVEILPSVLRVVRAASKSALSMT
jgi:hypothetical protein